MSDQYTQPFPSVSAAPIQCCSHPLPDMQAEWTSNRHPGRCNQANGAKCCKPDTRYPQYHCSPPITGATKARMPVNDFSAGGDGGGPSKCDEKYHSNKEKIVALSTGWFDNGNRCGKKIRISGNGNSVPATVVDECDSVNGCDTTSSLRATGISWTHRERCERRWESLNRRSATILSLGPTHRTANHSDLA